MMKMSTFCSDCQKFYMKIFHFYMSSKHFDMKSQHFYTSNLHFEKVNISLFDILTVNILMYTRSLASNQPQQGYM